MTIIIEITSQPSVQRFVLTDNKETSKVHIIVPLWGESGEFSPQRDSDLSLLRINEVVVIPVVTSQFR